MAKRKSSIASVLMFLILIVAAIGLVSLFFTTDLFEDNSLVVTIDGQEYKKDVSGIFLADGEEIQINISDYTYQIYGQSVIQNDVVFAVYGQIFDWSSIANRNYTSRFNLKTNDNGLTISYNNLNAVISKYVGCNISDVQLLYAEYGVSIFVLNVITNNNAINIGFTLSNFTDDVNIRLDIDEIIF